MNLLHDLREANREQREAISVLQLKGVVRPTRRCIALSRLQLTQGAHGIIVCGRDFRRYPDWALLPQEAAATTKALRQDLDSARHAAVRCKSRETIATESTNECLAALKLENGAFPRAKPVQPPVRSSARATTCGSSHVRVRCCRSCIGEGTRRSHRPAEPDPRKVGRCEYATQG